MPAKDLYHDSLKQALINDGWIILKENYELKYRGDTLYPDLAAEKSIVASRGTQKILVEIKSFLGRSFIRDLQAAIGQYVMYRDVIQARELGFKLYLAITTNIHNTGFQTPLAQLILQQNQVNLLIFDAEQETLTQWINATDTDN